MKILDSYIVDDIVSRYKSGQTIEEIRKQLLLSQCIVSKYLKLSNIKIKTIFDANNEHKLTDDEKSIIHDMYNKNNSIPDISNKTQRSWKTIYQYLLSLNIVRTKSESINLAIHNGKKRIHRFNEHVFDTWTPESAWLFGLILGDGHLLKNGEGLNLVGSLDVMELAARILSYTGKIKRRVYNNNNKMILGDCYGFRVNSVYISNLFYNKYGIRGKKAHVIRFPELPAGMKSHLARGLMDADGGWTNRYLAHYTSTSRVIIDDFIDIFNNLNITYRLYERLYDNNSWCYIINLNKNESTIFAEYIYTDSYEAIRCPRKYDLAINHKWYPILKRKNLEFKNKRAKLVSNNRIT